MDTPGGPATPLAEVYQSFLDGLALAGTRASTIHRHPHDIMRFEPWLVDKVHPAIPGIRLSSQRRAPWFFFNRLSPREPSRGLRR